MPDRREVEVAATLKPAGPVGGDLWDLVLQDDLLWFIVGDVSGKGIGAALHMAVTTTLFRATVEGDPELSEVVSRMNGELCRDNDQMMFTTAIVGHLSLATGDLALVDAGHNPAFLLAPGGGRSVVPVPKGMALGVAEGVVYLEHRCRLDSGATLLVYTDGATDARSPSGEIFGADRLDRVIDSVASGSPDTVVRAILDAVARFESGAPPADDLALLALRYRGRS